MTETNRGQASPNPLVPMGVAVAIIAAVVTLLEAFQVESSIYAAENAKTTEPAPGPFVSNPIESLIILITLGCIVISAALLMKYVDGKEHPVTTFATLHYVEPRDITEPALEPCADCGWIADAGTIREYRKDLILFGYPITVDQGENRYCTACHDQQPIIEFQP